MGMDTSKLIASSYMMVIGLGMGLVMPLLTLVLQETFPKSELGVVTSSSQFFRQIGGTFGMTILGAIMNSRSSGLLTEQLAPVMKQLPPQAGELGAAITSKIHSDPQSIYSMLLNPETLKQMPEAMTAKIVPILKAALVDSLHSVFLYGLIFVLLGAVLTFFLGRIKLSDRKAARKESLKASPSHG
jgi:hypothetical protein